MQEPEPEEAAAGGLPVEPGQCPAERAEREPVPRLAEGLPEETSAGGQSAPPEAEGLAAEPEAQGVPGEPAAVPEVAAVPAESA